MYIVPIVANIKSAMKYLKVTEEDIINEKDIVTGKVTGKNLSVIDSNKLEDNIDTINGLVHKHSYFRGLSITKEQILTNSSDYEIKKVSENCIFVYLSPEQSELFDLQDNGWTNEFLILVYSIIKDSVDLCDINTYDAVFVNLFSDITKSILSESDKEDSCESPVSE